MQDREKDTREILGLQDGRPYVVWLPTFRVAADRNGSVLWSNTCDQAKSAELTTDIEPVLGQLRESGFAVVVKPHPLDGHNRQMEGVSHITDVELSAEGLTLYNLLAHSSGLITDYSSVWIDYLLLSRPIGLFAPDVDAVAGSRPPVPSWSIAGDPGYDLLEGPASVRCFIDAVAQSNHGQADSRATRGMQALGMQPAGGAVASLLDSVAKSGIVRGFG